MNRILATLKDVEEHLVTESDGSFSAKYDGYLIKSAFQPIQATEGGLFGYEALARVYNKAGDELNTEPFFTSTFLETTDQVNLDRLARVIHVKNFAQYFPDHVLFLNMVPDALLSHHKHVPASLLHERLKEHGLLASQVFFELLEHDCARNAELQQALKEMREQGMNIAMDDYGVKASSERRARLLHPDMIKVDRSLLAGYLAGNQQPLLSVVRLAKELRATLLLEGVENEAGCSAARALGADYIQGFHLGRPQLLSDMLE
ncbi:EAL domain-containing protein [Photobacterium sp. 1_MG-2023]|uniref:EAL domain-containing protein n=1 Tax=Photobacterium sp. 1_MG-2023 TaxID=3062646 RepID=UPI0026E1E109|nr:EAL domain-containing protein [Photobacterium sp. 1_MG-2023]MDO6705946.1 EAL domain-containing protein [Photobacterium sp. 1_MG-2023]